MRKYIVYMYEGKKYFCIPSGELSVEETARKDVPAASPYLIVDESELPDDSLEYFVAWEVDFSNPTGYGIGHEAWFEEQKAKQAEQNAVQQ